MTYATYADLLRPSERSQLWIYNIALVLGGSLLIGLSAQITIPLPFSPVPITGQTLAVLLAGALLGSKRGGLCLLTYLAEGVAGLPVFSGGMAGPTHLLGPTGGYLIGFVAAAALTGLLAERGWDRRLWSNLAAMVTGNLVIYGFGLTWLAVFVGLNQALTLGVYPFLLGDVIKVAIATLLLPLGWLVLPILRPNP